MSTPNNIKEEHLNQKSIEMKPVARYAFNSGIDAWSFFHEAENKGRKVELPYWSCYEKRSGTWFVKEDWSTAKDY